MAETFPRRWAPGPHFKSTQSAKVAHAVKRKPIVAAEERHKTAVRRRDGYCRFPLCGCRDFKLGLHVAHLQHKGSGGNPQGDRSQPGKMILLCSARHHENRVSLDKGTVRIVPLTKRGTAGPCKFLVEVGATKPGPVVVLKLVEVARERVRHVFEPFTMRQLELLEQLRRMEL